MFYPKLFPVSLLYYCIVYVNLVKDRSSWRSRFQAESGCKGKEFFAYPPNFCGTFFEVFFGARLRGSLLKSGCKGKELFSNRQMFCEVFFRKFFEGRPEGVSPLGPLLRKAGLEPELNRRTARKTALQHYVKHQRFVSESGCKSTAYYRICKLIPTFFGGFRKDFMQKTDLQVCYKAGFLRAGKKERERDTL